MHHLKIEALCFAGLLVLGSPANAAVTLSNTFLAAIPQCGLKIDDWCVEKPGDPCARHLNAKACKADRACYGLPYRGESLVACQFDKRGFGLNCPTVGCTSTPPQRSR